MAIAAIFLPASAGFSQNEAVLLRYHWTAGQQSRYVMSAQGQGQLVIRGQMAGQPFEVPMPVTVSLNGGYQQLVKSVDQVGNAGVEMRWEPTRFTANVGGMAVEGTMDLMRGSIISGGQQQPLPGVSTAQLGVVPTIKVSPQGQILATSGLEQLMPLTANTGLAASFGQMTPTRMLGVSTVELPTYPIAVGQQWQYASPMPFLTEAGAPVARHSSTYTLEGFTHLNGEPCVKIKREATVQLTNLPTPAPITGQSAATTGMGMTLKSLSLTVNSDSYFGYETGKLIKTQAQMIMNQTMDWGGIELELQNFVIQLVTTCQ